MNNSSIDNKLSNVKYYADSTSHLILDKEKCKLCKDKKCLSICPANVYQTEGDEIKIEYENCLECGACRIVCDNINWNYPKSAKGVLYRFS